MRRTHIGVACKKHGYTTNLTEGGRCSACAEEDGRNKSEVGVGLYNKFTPWTYEDITDHPIHVTSKAQLKAECKKYGVTACRLM